VAHDLSAGPGVLDQVAACARAALAAYAPPGAGDGPVPGPAVTLLNVSENATFLVTGADGERSVLRVHRLGYHDVAAIESELAWMDALRREAGVRTPRVIPGAEPAGAGGGPRALAHFAELGALTARMHAHARRWRRPAWFTRFRWSAADAFGRDPGGALPGRWGRWRDGVGVGRPEAEVLARLEARLRARLAAYGSGPGRFGLIHADTRLANLLVHQGTTAIIDFDDCGLGWYLYDLGTSVSFFEDDPAVPALVAAWLAGYQAGGGVLTAADRAEAWTFILFRRLLLTAWIGSHPAAAGAAELGPAYARGTCDLAESYLAGSLDRLARALP
jgi:Ser/Thr protein kinase RdoA (MazF antagonist)